MNELVETMKSLQEELSQLNKKKEMQVNITIENDRVKLSMHDERISSLIAELKTLKMEVKKLQ